MSSEYWQERTELLIGKDKINKLNKAHVLVVGLGGVHMLLKLYVGQE